MSSRIPIVKQIAWVSFIPQVIIMILLVYIGYKFHSQYGFLIGTLLYLSIFFILRITIPKHHNSGMRKVKEKNFESAIADFEKSYAYFHENGWVDQLRFITMLSSSLITYKEMAMLNIAFCHGQMGNRNQSISFYEETLEKYPDNEMAKSALRMIDPKKYV